MGGGHAGHAAAEDEHFGADMGSWIIGVPGSQPMDSEEEGEQCRMELVGVHWAGGCWGVAATGEEKWRYHWSFILKFLAVHITGKY